MKYYLIVTFFSVYSLHAMKPSCIKARDFAEKKLDSGILYGKKVICDINDIQSTYHNVSSLHSFIADCSSEYYKHLIAVYENEGAHSVARYLDFHRAIAESSDEVQCAIGNYYVQSFKHFYVGRAIKQSLRSHIIPLEQDEKIICMAGYNTIGSSFSDGTFLIRNANTGDIIQQFLVDDTYDQPVLIENMCTLNDDYLFSRNENGTSNVWNIITGACEDTIGHEITGGHFLNRGNIFVIDNGFSYLYSFDKKEKRLLFDMPSAISSLHFFPFNNYIFWTKDTVLYGRSLEEPLLDYQQTFTWDHRESIKGACEIYSKDAVVSHTDSTLYVWDLMMGSFFCKKNFKNENIYNIVPVFFRTPYNSSYERILVQQRTCIQMYDPQTNRIERSFKKHEEKIRSIFPCSDYTRFVSFDDHIIHVWENTNEEPLYTFKHGNSWIYNVYLYTYGKNDFLVCIIRDEKAHRESEDKVLVYDLTDGTIVGSLSSCIGNIIGMEEDVRRGVHLVADLNDSLHVIDIISPEYQEKINTCFKYVPLRSALFLEKIYHAYPDLEKRPIAQDLLAFPENTRRMLAECVWGKEIKSDKD